MKNFTQEVKDWIMSDEHYFENIGKIEAVYKHMLNEGYSIEDFDNTSKELAELLEKDEEDVIIMMEMVKEMDQMISRDDLNEIVERAGNKLMECKEEGRELTFDEFAELFNPIFDMIGAEEDAKINETDDWFYKKVMEELGNLN